MSFSYTLSTWPLVHQRFSAASGLPFPLEMYGQRENWWKALKEPHSSRYLLLLKWHCMHFKGNSLPFSPFHFQTYVFESLIIQLHVQYQWFCLLFIIFFPKTPLDQMCCFDCFPFVLVSEVTMTVFGTVLHLMFRKWLFFRLQTWFHFVIKPF